MDQEIEIKFSHEIISSYKRLSYKVWYALAEFVDNSTQAYIDNKALLDAKYLEEGTSLSVNIEYYKDSQSEDLVNDYILIEDNSIGMSLEDLKKAFQIGDPPQNRTGRSRYGLGMKTASFWLGDTWTIITKKLGDSKEYTIRLNEQSISSGSLKMNVESVDQDLNLHYTKIKVENLHRRYKGKTITKIKSFLSSIYRFDLSKKRLRLIWNQEELNWINYIDEDFVKNSEGKPYKRAFTFTVNNKEVTGWAGILSRGGRDKGGFALIQNERVIMSPPQGYKPEGIYGDQEGGTNDLINQRIVGEIFLEGFEVSHTKDSIVWEKTEEDDLSNALVEEIGDFKKVALDHRSTQNDHRGPSDKEFGTAVEALFEEIESGEWVDALMVNELQGDEIIYASNKALIKVTVERETPQEISLNGLTVRLYIDDGMSPNDPYVLNDSTNSADEVIIIVNRNHPYYSEIEGTRGALNFLRHCVYDGVSEWKAFRKNGTILPDTVKFIKDDLLRVPFSIEKAKI